MSVLGRLPGALIRRIRHLCLQVRGVRIDGRCWIRSVEIVGQPGDIHLHNGVMLDRHVTLLATGPGCEQPRIEICEKTYINRFTMLDASERIHVGANCMIGPSCYITDHDHGMIAGQQINQQPLNGSPVSVGNDVWIGAHVTILKGVTIGDHAVIGAGSVVTNDVPEGAIVAGVPGRVLRMRELQSQSETSE